MPAPRDTDKVRKKRVGILCGGPSTEHAISLLSSRNVIDGAIAAGFDVSVIGIDHDGRWWYYEDGEHVRHPDDAKKIGLETGGRPVLPSRDPSGDAQGGFIEVESQQFHPLDVAFPVMHGRGGEDGAIQGVLSLVGLPFVGCDVTAAAVCMDKAFTKTVLAQAGVPVVPWRTYHRTSFNPASLLTLEHFPVFVKPATHGSSVGISKVDELGQLALALEAAFEYDDKVLVEPGIDGRELECAVLGNSQPEASGLGEIVPPDGFYSFDAKYLNDETDLVFDPDLDRGIERHIRRVAIDAFEALGCRGLARVDFFLTKAGEVLVNEVNTMPGFTAISMYPKLWERRGVPLPELIERLVKLAK